MFDILSNDEALLKLKEKGCHRLNPGDKSVGMICNYLHKSQMPVTVENIRNEIRSWFENVQDHLFTILCK